MGARTDTATKVGERIRALRQAQGLSQRAVAQPLMTAAYLSLIELGQRPPSAKAVRHIARRLGVEPEEILTGRPSGLQSRLELAIQEARVDANAGRVEEAQSALFEVVAAAGRFDLKRVEGKALTVLAALAERRGQVEDALSMFEQALQIFADEPRHLCFEAMVGLARCTHAEGDSRMAAHVLETYLIDLRKGGVEDPTAKMRVLSSLIHFYRALGMERRAAEVAQEAMGLSPYVEDPEQIACMNMNVARVLVEEGRHDDAVEALRRAEQLFQVLEWPLPATRARINKGIVEATKGDFLEAKTTFLEALRQLEAFPGERRIRGEVLNELARVERQAGEVDAAIDHLTKARRLLEGSDALERAVNTRELGLCMTSRDPARAERELKKAARSFMTSGSVGEASRTLVELARLFNSQQRTIEATKILDEALDLASLS